MNNENISLTAKVTNEILKTKCIENDDKIVVAVSGGPDSMTLLDVLYKLKDEMKNNHNISYEISVAHVNHMLREESFKEKEYVENFCKNKNINFYYLQKDVANESTSYKMGIEEYARKVRYDFFEKVRIETNSNKIAVAHNLDDNVETILLNILRGCGIKGLCGMQVINKNIIRPLLGIYKEEILNYCLKNDLNPCFDKTNEQEIYTRNKIRLDLIPKIEKDYNSNFKGSILRLRKLAMQDEEFLNEITKQIVDKAILNMNEEHIIFNFSNILKQSNSIKQRSIIEIINRKMNNVEGLGKIHIMDILKLLENNISRKKYIFGNKFTIEIMKKYIAKIY